MLHDAPVLDTEHVEPNQGFRAETGVDPVEHNEVVIGYCAREGVAETRREVACERTEAFNAVGSHRGVLHVSWVERLGDRWTVLVVGAQSNGSLRYSELRKRVDGVSQKMLTQTLRGLERDGLVLRTMTPQIPPRVDYELTEAGQSLRAPLKALEDWATEHMASVLEAREVYDKAQQT